MTSDLNMKDKLIVKEDVQMNDFKSVGLFVMIQKLDIYAYRNNYDFEGNLIKQIFMDNYGQLIKMYDEMKESEFSAKQKIVLLNHQLETFLEQKNRLADVLRRLNVYRDSLDDQGVSLTEAYHSLQKSSKDL